MEEDYIVDTEKSLNSAFLYTIQRGEVEFFNSELIILSTVPLTQITLHLALFLFCILHLYAV